MTQPALINALSGFWHRFFADLGDIEALYAGTEILAAQFYVELMNEILGSSVADAPLARPENFRVWRVKDTDVEVRADGWFVKSPVSWHNVRYLQDGVVDPHAILDPGRDFFVKQDGVLFQQDPRKTLSRAASRGVSVEIGGKITGTDVTGVGAGDTVTLSDGREYGVLYAREWQEGDELVGELGLHPRSKVLAGTATTWSCAAKNINARPGLLVGVTRIPYSAQITERAVWVVDARVDDRLLYRGLGSLLSHSSISDETYRNFIRGMSRLNLIGPSLLRLEEGLTAAAGLPLARRDGEVVTYVAGNTVRTTDATYVIPAGIRLKESIQSGAKLRAFQTFTDVVRAIDSTTHPRWWYGKTIPQELLPGLSEAARVASPDVYENRIGSIYKGSVGDPYVYIGVEKRHGTSFELTHSVLQHNLFGVWVDPVLELVTPGVFARLKEIVQGTRPSHTYPYVWSSSTPPQ